MVIAAGDARARGCCEAGGNEPGEDGVAHVAVDAAGDVFVAELAAEQEQEQGGVCRICHLEGGDGDGELPERVGGRLMRLGCGCRGELAVAHRRCAEAWFSVRGDRCCEICDKSAVNIDGCAGSKQFMRQWNQSAGMDGGGSSRECDCSRSQACCSLLAVCAMLAFILPWLRHSHVI